MMRVNLFHWGLPVQCLPRLSKRSGDPDHRDLSAISYVYLARPVEPGTLRVFNWGETFFCILFLWGVFLWGILRVFNWGTLVTAERTCPLDLWRISLWFAL